MVLVKKIKDMRGKYLQLILMILVEEEIKMMMQGHKNSRNQETFRNK